MGKKAIYVAVEEPATDEETAYRFTKLWLTYALPTNSTLRKPTRATVRRHADSMMAPMLNRLFTRHAFDRSNVAAWWEDSDE